MEYQWVIKKYSNQDAAESQLHIAKWNNLVVKAYVP